MLSAGLDQLSAEVNESKVAPPQPHTPAVVQHVVVPVMATRKTSALAQDTASIVDDRILRTRCEGRKPTGRIHTFGRISQRPRHSRFDLELGDDA